MSFANAACCTTSARPGAPPTSPSTPTCCAARASSTSIFSQTLEAALVVEVAERARQRWLAENRGAIDAYNREVERNGCFADSLRSF